MDIFVPVHCQHGTPRICQHGVALWLENYGVILQHQQAERNSYFSDTSGVRSKEAGEGPMMTHHVPSMAYGCIQDALVWVFEPHAGRKCLKEIHGMGNPLLMGPGLITEE